MASWDPIQAAHDREVVRSNAFGRPAERRLAADRAALEADLAHERKVLARVEDDPFIVSQANREAYVAAVRTNIATLERLLRSA